MYFSYDTTKQYVLQISKLSNSVKFNVSGHDISIYLFSYSRVLESHRTKQALIYQWYFNLLLNSFVLIKAM
jgi:hypothetical protein